MLHLHQERPYQTKWRGDNPLIPHVDAERPHSWHTYRLMQSLQQFRSPASQRAIHLGSSAPAARRAPPPAPRGHSASTYPGPDT
ncbi:hypothetical protein EVAR_22067_1 [Eumeta japonica]|uniref:Uncharacterized protein n=1 Tax=Eumeta variegata TaxID=151549 RepID=A0A4C1USN6_EUMVA|nr:hypothetical protein EVAR_22067_1 [Eumeta japonica]